mmetsp:Transcript_1386/g.3804  ORF Transcript_1386/g.3804 Transcript_1386/m.3804 type:complete len:114 (-) Transcript_1386:3367-3708(-)
MIFSLMLGKDTKRLESGDMCDNSLERLLVVSTRPHLLPTTKKPTSSHESLMNGLQNNTRTTSQPAVADWVALISNSQYYYSKRQSTRFSRRNRFDTGGGTGNPKLKMSIQTAF